jgi:hypothetical protein
MTMFALICVCMTLAILPCGMISVADEQLMTLAQLAKRLPQRRNSRPVHPSTLHRWRHPGIRGIRLECIRIGAAWHSSVEALQRFCDRLTQLEMPTEPTQIGVQSATEDQVRQEQVERELKDLGA